MDEICNDNVAMIFQFISLRYRIYMREVNKRFNLLISHYDISRYSLKNKLYRVFSLQHRYGANLMLSLNDHMIIYTLRNQDNNNIVHPLFRLNVKRDKCINSDCSKKKMGDCFIPNVCSSVPLYISMISYKKKYIPYCVECFNKWGFYSDKEIVLESG